MKDTQKHAIVNMIYDKLMDNSEPLKVELVDNPILDCDTQQIMFKYENRQVTINIKIA